jgi:lysophospholipase L1-like esterase
MKKKIFLVLSLCYVFFGISCVSNDANQGKKDEIKIINRDTTSFVANQENVRFLGRTYFDNDVLWAIYSSSGAEFNVKAKRLDVCFKGDSQANLLSPEGQTGLARVVVFVNGERKLDELIYQPEQNFVVFDGTEEVEGVVQIIKVSEVANSVAGIKAISLDEGGKLWPTEQKELKIEFIGDSITCGYGVDDEDRNHHFSTTTEDSTKTYAYKTAQALNADYSFVSISGWGVISGYTSNPAKKSEYQVLPKYYDKLGFSYGSSFDGNMPQNIQWDFSFEPDIVVINLGTNDDSYCKGDKDKVAEFTREYKNFITKIRRYNPDAYILCTLGIMGNSLFPAIQNAVNEFQTETGDQKVDTLQFANQNMADGIAADWHPTEKTNEKAAKLLIEKLREKMPH